MQLLKSLTRKRRNLYASSLGFHRLLLVVLVLCILIYFIRHKKEVDVLSPSAIMKSFYTAPRLEVILVAWNEAHILPYTVRFYRKRFPAHSVFLTIYDNESSDGTEEVARELGCNVVTYSSGGALNDGLYMHIKNNAWKNSTADWIIVGDADEWIDVTPTDLDVYEAANVTIVRAEGVILVWPEDTMDLTRRPDTLRVSEEGSALGYSKPALFDRRAIVNAGIIPGAHMAYPTGRVVWLSDVQPHISILTPALYHAKYFNARKSIERYAAYKTRMSPENRQNGWGGQYFEANATTISEEYVRLRKLAMPLSQDLL